MVNRQILPFSLLLITLFTVASCNSQQQKYLSPPGYNLNNPERYKMPYPLREISGIAFNQGRKDTIYAEEDENGKVYHFRLGDHTIQSTRFWKKGDFEDISICNHYIIMLRSDGTLFTFPIGETGKPQADRVKYFDGLLPAGEFEGLASADSSGQVYVLCKHCSDEKTSKWGGGYILQMDSAGTLRAAGNFVIRIKEIEAITGTGKMNFHPSGLAKNPATREWFILSSVNHILVIADENWKVKSVYP